MDVSNGPKRLVIRTRLGTEELIARLRLFSNPGSAAHDNLIVDEYFRPRFNDPGSKAALELLGYWFHGCRKRHLRCRRDFFDGEQHTDLPILPTRVIDVGPMDGSEEPRLIITNGLRANYFTLSHSWGTLKFLTTTSANLQDHLRMIPFSKLSKTFQDSVIITRFLEFRYL